MGSGGLVPNKPLTSLGAQSLLAGVQRPQGAQTLPGKILIAWEVPDLVVSNLVVCNF